MKTTVKQDVETMWGGKLAAGTEIGIEQKRPGLYLIIQPEEYSDCFIGPEDIQVGEEEHS